MTLREKLKELHYRPECYYDDEDEDKLNPIYEENCYRKSAYRERDNGEILFNLLLKGETVWWASIYSPMGGIKAQSDIDDLQRAYNILKSDLKELGEYNKTGE